MAGITAAQAQAKLDLWLTAEESLAKSQSYEIDTGSGRRKLTRADLSEVRESVKYWQDMVTRLSRTRSRTRYYVPDSR